MIEPNMKTLNSNADNTSINHGRFRFVLVLLGIVIAMLCLVAFVQDLNAAQTYNANLPQLFETSKIFVVNFTGNVMTLIK